VIDPGKATDWVNQEYLPKHHLPQPTNIALDDYGTIKMTWEGAQLNAFQSSMGFSDLTAPHIPLNEVHQASITLYYPTKSLIIGYEYEAVHYGTKIPDATYNIWESLVIGDYPGTLTTTTVTESLLQTLPPPTQAGIIAATGGTSAMIISPDDKKT
jgi:hypothetical protein